MEVADVVGSLADRSPQNAFLHIAGQDDHLELKVVQVHFAAQMLVVAEEADWQDHHPS